MQNVDSHKYFKIYRLVNINLIIYIKRRREKMNATRSKPKCQSDCTDHVFDLKNNNGNNKHNVCITFCPKFRRDPHPPQKTIPEYNKDNKYFTHAFVLGTEKKVVASNTQHQFMHFQTMIKDACQKNNQIFFPRPNQKNCYCSVCKQHFKNYHQHIRSESHRTKIDAAIYNTEIKRLCDFYKKQWDGAHAKADQIVSELIRQSQLLKKGIVQDQSEDKQQNEEMQNEEIEEQQDEQKPQDGEQQQKQKQEQQNNENQNQEGNEDQNMQEQEMQLQQQIQDNNKLKNAQSQNTKKKVKQSQLQIPIHKVNQKMGDQDNDLKNKINSLNSFLSDPSQLIIYLKRKKNGKYQVIQNVQKFIKLPSVTAPEQKQQRMVGQKQEKMHKQKLDKIQKQKVKQEQKRQRKERQKDKDYVMKPVKQHRQIHKIKHPPRERQQQSEYKDNQKSFSYSSDKGLCQNLKNRVMNDRIRTRNQLKDHQQKKQRIQGASKQKSSQVISKPKQQRNSSNNNKQSESMSRQKYSKSYQQQQMTRQNPYMPPYMYNQPPISPQNMSMQKTQSPINQSRNMSPGMQKMPMQHPSYQMYPQQGQPMPSKGMGNDPNMRNNPYMAPHYQMMNPSPYYNPSMMGYNMPPGQMRGDSAQKQDQKYKERPPPQQQSQQPPQQQYPPMYYQNSWNPYMMGGHPQMMRPQNPNQQPNHNQNMNRQHMPHPSHPSHPSYHMMQNPNNPNAQKQNPNMNPNMYMQYPQSQMNPQYPYMNHPSYMQKKPDQAREQK